jgi:hypothetical protein
MRAFGQRRAETSARRCAPHHLTPEGQTSPGRLRPQEHRIAVTEESITLLNGMPIGIQDTIGTRKRGNEHQQRGLRQMKIGQHGVDRTKFVAWQDKKIGLSTGWLQLAATGCTLEGTN